MAKKFRDVRKGLRGAGWIKVRQAGSHETWESPDGERAVTVAGKDSDTVLSARSLRSRDEAETRIAEALAAHLAYLRESGRPVPEPHTHAGRVAA